jgi:hypothetical protein
MPDFYWDPSVARFRDEAGQFVANDVVQGYVDDSLFSLGNAIDPIVDLALDGTITPGDLETQIREHLKREYLRQYYLGIGGRKQMTQADYGSIGGMLRFQYDKLSGFIEEIASGDLSEARIRARMRMYTNSARQAFEKAKHKSKTNAGYRYMRWVLNPALENCEDCQAFAAMGWQLIVDDPFDGCMPSTGCTVCLTNCGCFVEYAMEVA